MSRLSVAVLMGGISPERDISLVTGRAVIENLPPGDFDPVPVEVMLDGSWRGAGQPPVPPELGVARLRELGVDVVFPGLHGKGGEDGALQGMLETAGMPYVGSGVAASGIAMDKARSRDVAKCCGIAMPRALEISGADVDQAAEQVLEVLGLPAVVKDPEGGSSIGVTVADTEDCLREALATQLGRPSRRVLIEEFIEGREFTCGVLGNASLSGPLTALPPLLVEPLKSRWFSYETKYDPEGFRKIGPQEGDEETLSRVRDAAITIHRVLCCDGLTRTDFIVPESGVPLFLEINTLPGLTPTSLCPAAAKLAGVDFPEVLGLLVNMAIDRDRARSGRGAKEAE